jgi:hypothetical protein
MGGTAVPDFEVFEKKIAQLALARFSLSVVRVDPAVGWGGKPRGEGTRRKV